MATKDATRSADGSAPPMGRVAAAAFAGTTIEFYDFYIFGTATALVFGKVFFGEIGGARGTLALAATFAVAFLARPFGSILFGHLGDKLGRKRTLIYTLLLMGLSTFAIGLIPSSATIGVAAPIILVALRFLQGLAVGGEWAGAALLTSEYAPPGRRGLYGMFPQIGPAIAFALSSLTFLAVFLITGDPTKNDAFQTWGWRLPFLFSIVLVAVGLYVRLRIEETPVFKAVVERSAPVRVPVRAAVKAQWRQILLTGGTLTGVFGFFYIGSVFVTGYAGRNPQGVPPGTLGLATPTILIIDMVAAAAFAVACVASALWSDRIGRRKVILAGNAAAVVVGLVVFPIMDTGDVVLVTVGLSLIFCMVGVPYGPAAAYLPEMFDPVYRYTAAGIGYNLAGVLGGAFPLIVASALLATYGSFAVGIYLALLALISMLCVIALPETRTVDIHASREPAAL